MHSPRKLSLLFAPAAILFLATASDVSAQEFQNPEIESRRSSTPPAPLRLNSEVELLNRDAEKTEHSILVDAGSTTVSGTKTSAPVFPQLKGAKPNTFPAPSEDTSAVRLPGDGTDDSGTFATSDHMPPKSLIGGQAAASAPKLPLTSNGLRGPNPASRTSTKQQGPPPTTTFGGGASDGGLSVGAPLTGGAPMSRPPATSFGDQQPTRDFGMPKAQKTNPPQSSVPPAWDQQPLPPQRTNRNSKVDAAGGLPPVTSQMSQTPARRQNSRRNFGNQQGLNRQAKAIQPMNTAAPIQSNFGMQGTGIQQTQFAQDAANNNVAGGAQKPNAAPNLKAARQIMAKYHIDNAPDPLPGRPVKLLEMLEKTPVQQRTVMLAQYWETYFDWASTQNASEYLSWLQKLPPPRTPDGQALLKTAKVSARNNVLASEIQLGKSQSKLQQFLSSDKDSLLPLPSDTPLIQTYETHFDWFSKRGMIPSRLRGIDTMLPKSIELIALRANAVASSRNALSQVKAAYTANPTTLGTVIQAARLWNEAEQDLVATIVNYNQAVADYSITVTQGRKTPKQIVGMLVTKEKPSVAAQPAARLGANTLPRQSSRANGMQTNRPLNNRPMTSRSDTDLSPSGFTNRGQGGRAISNRAPRQPIGNPVSNPVNSVPKTNFGNSGFGGAPVSNPPATSVPSTGGGFSVPGGAGAAGGLPPVTPGNSKSANDFNTFGT